MSGFMWRESLPFGSYTRTLRGKVLEPMSRSSHEVCNGRCHHRAAGKTVRSPLHAPARHTARLTPRGGGLRVSRVPRDAPPERAAPLSTATGPAPRSCGEQTRSPSSAKSTLIGYKLTVDGLTAKTIIKVMRISSQGERTSGNPNRRGARNGEHREGGAAPGRRRRRRRDGPDGRVRGASHGLTAHPWTAHLASRASVILRVHHSR